MKEDGVFPGARVRCACGVESEVPRTEGSPYREPARIAPTAAIAEPAAPHATKARACPRCRSPLGDLHACAVCGGEFVAHGELAPLIEGADAERETDDPSAWIRSAGGPAGSLDAAVRYIPCPVCGDTMNRTSFAERSGVVVDVCKAHGAWFDRGELEASLAFVRHGGLAKARRERAARAKAPDALAERARAEAEVALAYEGAREAEEMLLVTRAVRLASTPAGPDLLHLLLALTAGR